jgi:branched-chain amino acid transport system ATP-binding protein
MTPVLEIHNLCKSFGGLPVLTGVDLAVRAGERHVLIGPNGAGKTTLFAIVSGRLSPTQGKIRYNGLDVTGRSMRGMARAGLARSFQIINVFPNLTVQANVRTGVLARNRQEWVFWRPVSTLRDVAAQTDEILEIHGLTGHATTLASELSYGNQRRLEIALAYALDPRLMLLDEPCAGLNADDTHETIALIARVSRDRSLLMVEHDMEVVFGLADRISVLHYGRIIATGAPDEIQRDPAVQEAYLGRGAHGA